MPTEFTTQYLHLPVPMTTEENNRASTLHRNTASKRLPPDRLLPNARSFKITDADSDRDSRAATHRRQSSESARLLVKRKHYVRICCMCVCSQSAQFPFRLMIKSTGMNFSGNNLLRLRDMMELKLRFHDIRHN